MNHSLKKSIALLAVLISTTSSFGQETILKAYLESARKTQTPAKKSDLYRMALKEAEDLRKPPVLIQTLFEIGTFEISQGNFLTAERLMKRGIALEKSPLGLAHCNSLIGNLYLAWNRPEKALPYFKKSVDLRDANHSPQWELGNAISGLAECYYLNGDYASSAPLFSKAVSLLENDTNHKYQLGKALLGLANLKLAEKDAVSADALVREAILLFEKTERTDIKDVAFCKITLAQTKELNGDSEQALVLYESAISTIDTPNPSNSIRILPALDSMVKLLRKNAKPEEAIPFEDRAVQIRKLCAAR